MHRTSWVDRKRWCVMYVYDRYSYELCSYELCSYGLWQISYGRCSYEHCGVLLAILLSRLASQHRHHLVPSLLPRLPDSAFITLSVSLLIDAHAA